VGFMNDPEYVPYLKSRTEGSVSFHFLVEAEDELHEFCFVTRFGQRIVWCAESD